jgi:DNA polymerase-3 subunit epsilon/CBS domain-containing protein
MELRRIALQLAAIDAVALDIESTGLDPRKSRIVEVGAIRIKRGAPAAEDNFRRLVRPEVRIPVEAVHIHGIDDRAVADAPLFAEVWPDLSAYLDASILVGHTLGFDIAILGHECRRIGRTFHASAAVDVRVLSEVIEPGLAGYSLEHLASWLSIPISNRHSALGDARAAAEIFCALVPRLRERGIRTVGEALHACENFSRNPALVRIEAWNAGLDISTVAPATSRKAASERVDVYFYRHQISELMSAPARWIAGAMPVSSALGIVGREKISSLFVAEGPEPLQAAECGIVTERDILRTIRTHGFSGLALPVCRIATRPLKTIAANDFAYQAIARMNRFGIRHLGVVDEAGKLIGALSARDLMRLRAEGAAKLSDEIEQADDAASLAQAWSELPPAAAALLAEGFSARDVAAVISNEIGALTKRAAVLAECELEKKGEGKPPAPYALMVLGSAGRYESLLAMDQDNALVFEDDAPAHADRWFAALGERLASILDEAGVPFCLGGVMAKKAAWRGSLSDWRARIGTWMGRSDPQDLLSVDIFFDLRGVHGNIGLANELRRYAFELASGRPEFCKLLIESGGRVQSALSWWGGFKTVHSRIDLKKAGLFGVVTAARALAIRHHVTAHSTPERLNAFKALQLGAENDLDSLIDAHELFLDLILKQQLEDIRRGLKPENTVEARRLSHRERKQLRAALSAAEHADVTTRDLLF